MKILAIDTSCDDSCVAILDTQSWKLLAEKTYAHTQAMERFGGIVPEIASREHLKLLPLAVQESLDLAGLSLEDIDWIAVTHRPGLIGSLLVGVSFAKALSFSLQKPFSVLHHIEAHLFSPLLCTLEGKEAPPFPWIALVVSGGHTEMFHVEGIRKYRWLGGTLDDAAGEAFDKVGKLLGMPYPAGPLIDKQVREKNPDRNLPFPRAKTDGLSFSFSGLKTAVSLYLQRQKTLTDELKLQVAASAQEAILDQLRDRTLRAKETYPDCQIVVSGGVACNSRLREKLNEAYFPLPRHCTDNASMVALLAGLHFKDGKLKPAPWTETAHASFD